MLGYMESDKGHIFDDSYSESGAENETKDDTYYFTGATDTKNRDKYILIGWLTLGCTKGTYQE